MLNYEEEDDEQMNAADELNRIIIERARAEFIAGCYEAYEILATKGEVAIQGTNPKEIENAINRMLALFVINEEYERCQFLKTFVDKHMPGFKLTPDSSVKKELSV